MPVNDPLPEDDPFDLVRRFGIQVVEVARLRDPVVYIDEHEIALIRAGLPAACLEYVASVLLSAALSPSARSGHQPG